MKAGHAAVVVPSEGVKAKFPSLGTAVSGSPYASFGVQAGDRDKVAHSKTARSSAPFQDVIAVYIGKLKALAFSAIGLTLTGVSILAILFPEKYETALPCGRSFMWIGVVLFGFITVRFLMFLMPSAPILTFTHEGIRVDPAVVGNFYIPWSQIHALRCVKVQGQGVLFVVLNDLTPLIEHQTRLQRGICLIFYWRLRSKRMITISDWVLSESLAEIWARVCTTFGNELARNHISIV